MNFVLLLPEIYFFCSLLIFLTYTSIFKLLSTKKRTFNNININNIKLFLNKLGNL